MSGWADMFRAKPAGETPEERDRRDSAGARKAVFDAVREICPEDPFVDVGNIYLMNNLLDGWKAKR